MWLQKQQHWLVDMTASLSHRAVVTLCMAGCRLVLEQFHCFIWTCMPLMRRVITHCNTISDCVELQYYNFKFNSRRLQRYCDFQSCVGLKAGFAMTLIYFFINDAYLIHNVWTLASIFIHIYIYLHKHRWPIQQFLTHNRILYHILFQ